MAIAEESQLVSLHQQLAELRQAILSGGPDSLSMVEMLLRDTQRRVAAERELTDVRAWMDLAQEAGGVATYRMDIRANRLWWSSSVYKLYEMDPSDGEPTVERWLTTIHPADRENVANVAREALEDGKPVDQSFRIALQSGEVRWVHDRGKVELDEHGRPSWLHGVNIDVTSLRRAQEDLWLSEQQFRTAFEYANIGVAHVALDGTFLEVNRYLAQFLGREATDLVGLTFQDITDPDDLGADLDLVEKLVSGHLPSYTLEKRYIRPDGESVWADLSVSCLRDSVGQPLNFVSVVADIKERKRAEEQLDLVLSEANHRVKNLLAVITAIVTNSMRTAKTVSELGQSMMMRIQGIAASHDLLIGKSERGGDLGELIRRQIAVFADCEASRVELSGPPIKLSPPSVQAFGMVLHELATNACKYGALSGEEGSVKVSWHVDEAENTLHFSWTEQGGPKIGPIDRKGFGTKALSRMLSGPLDAKVKHELPAEGARFTATIPLTKVNDISGN